MNNRKKRRHHKKASGLVNVFIIFGICILCFVAYIFFTQLISYNTSSDTYDNIRTLLQSDIPNNDNDNTVNNNNTRKDTIINSPGSIEKKESLLYNFDSELPTEAENEYDEGMTWNYKLLHEYNPDTIGYIKARGSGLVVDYPVVQREDNDYYLNHLFDGTYNSAGTIFMDYNSADKFDTPYCIIYGHNMSHGSRMFGYLKQYEYSSYFYEHTEYDVYTENAHYVYRVFAILLTYADDLIYTSPLISDYSDMSYEEREAEIKSMAEHALYNSQYDTGYTVDDFTYKSHIITLSTCYGGYSSPLRYDILLVRDRIVADDLQ